MTQLKRAIYFSRMPAICTAREHIKAISYLNLIKSYRYLIWLQCESCNCINIYIYQRFSAKSHKCLNSCLLLCSGLVHVFGSFLFMETLLRAWGCYIDVIKNMSKSPF